jgi:hypothetical protein
MPKPIVVSDFKSLREVVLMAIREHGPAVDLNFIDVTVWTPLIGCSKIRAFTGMSLVGLLGIFVKSFFGPLVGYSAKYLVVFHRCDGFIL